MSLNGYLVGNTNEYLSKIVKIEDRWPVYQTYCVMGPDEFLGRISTHDPEVSRALDRSVLELGGKEDYGVYVKAADLSEAADSYAPLSMPELFIEFAGLADKRVTPEVMLDWVRSYGVLGLDKAEGGPRDSLRRFVEEAERANSVLRLYEIVTAPDGPHPIQFHEYMNYVLNRPSVKAELPLKHATPQEQKETVLEWVADTVRQVLAQECYPTLYREEDEYRRGWGFRSLLGAMYLQMMQLVTTSGEEVRKCKRPDCPRIIAFEPGEPYAGPGFGKNVRGKYKTRIDKEFCSTNCRVKWRYHNVIKPRRESERAATS